MYCLETHPCVEPNKLGVIEGGVVDGEELGPGAPPVEPVSDRDGPEEEAQAEDGPVHAERLPSHPHGVQVQNFALEPRPNYSLCPPQLRPALALRPDPEEGPQGPELEAESLGSRRLHYLGHARH